MKFSVFFAASAVATSAVKRATPGIDQIIADIYKIGNGTQALTDKIQAYQDPTDAGEVLVVTQALEGIIRSADEDVTATPGPLSVNDAVALINPVTDLGNTVGASINATIAKQQLFYAVGLGLEVKIQLDGIQTLSNQFSSDLVALVPQSLQSTAQSLAQPITDTLQRGVNAYANATNIPTGAASRFGAASSVYQVLALAAAIGIAPLAF